MDIKSDTETHKKKLPVRLRKLSGREGWSLELFFWYSLLPEHTMTLRRCSYSELEVQILPDEASNFGLLNSKNVKDHVAYEYKKIL